MENQWLPIKISLGIVASFCLYFAILSISYSDLNNFLSLVISSSGGFFAVLLFYFMFKRDLSLNILYLALFCYFFRLTIGVVHYLYFFDPDYFLINFSDFTYLNEYIWLFESLEVFSSGLSGEMDQTLVEGYVEQNKNYAVEPTLEGGFCNYKYNINS